MSTTRLLVSVVGQDTLAAAIAHCCAYPHRVTRNPDPDADVLWLCHDTPINKDGTPDVEYIIDTAGTAIDRARPGTPVLFSSQVPIGTTRRLELLFPAHRFAHCPENIRVATAALDFAEQARIIVGRRTPDLDELYTRILRPFTENLIFTSPETAEMAKHALNCFLGLQIAWINEIARLCAGAEVDMPTVTEALRTDSRISPKAPLRAGAPFGGGHLARDITVLNAMADKAEAFVPIIRAILPSNQPAP